MSFTLLISVGFWCFLTNLLHPLITLCLHSLWFSFVASNWFVLCALLLDYLRPSHPPPRDHHSSSPALDLQCQPLYRPPSGPHLTPNRLHQQAPWSSPNHSHCACHSPATSPSSRPGEPYLWCQAGPRCPVAHHAARRNSRPPMSQRVSRWGRLYVYIILTGVHFFLSIKQSSSSCQSVLPGHVFVCMEYISQHVPKWSACLCAHSCFFPLLSSSVPAWVPPVGTVPEDSQMKARPPHMKGSSPTETADWMWQIIKLNARGFYLPSC